MTSNLLVNQCGIVFAIYVLTLDFSWHICVLLYEGGYNWFVISNLALP